MAFSLEKYFGGIVDELASYGFRVEISQRQNKESPIESAFIKANTLEHLLLVGYSGSYHRDGVVRIKPEVDRDSPLRFETEARLVLLPTVISVRTLRPSFLFAGKMHALLFRNWQHRVKGRDWYDFVWYVGRKVSLNLDHFNERYMQSENAPTGLSEEQFRLLLSEKIETLSIAHAKSDVAPFLRDAGSLELWSTEFFHQIAEGIEVELSSQEGDVSD